MRFLIHRWWQGFERARLQPRRKEVSPINGEPQRLKPHSFERLYGAPEGAPFQSRANSGKANLGNANLRQPNLDNVDLAPCSPEPILRMPAKNSVRRALHALIIASALFLFLGAGDADARFKDLGHRMMCACGCGQILLECNHVGCTYSDKMRNQLMASIDKGNNDDLVLQGFVQEYGPTVIAAPTATGFNRIAWIMPFLALGLGITFLIYIVRSWKNRPEPALADGIVIPQGRELDDLRRKARRETDL